MKKLVIGLLLAVLVLVPVACSGEDRSDSGAA